MWHVGQPASQKTVHCRSRRAVGSGEEVPFLHVPADRAGVLAAVAPSFRQGSQKPHHAFLEATQVFLPCLDQEVGSCQLALRPGPAPCHLHAAICHPFEVAAGDEGFGPWRPSARPPGWRSLHARSPWEPRVYFKLTVGPGEAGSGSPQATGTAPAPLWHPFQARLSPKAEGPEEGDAVSGSACEVLGDYLARLECFRKCWP